MGGYWLFRWITWFLVVVIAFWVINLKWDMDDEPVGFWIAYGLFNILWSTALVGLDNFANKVYRGGK